MATLLASILILILKLGAALTLGFSAFRLGILTDKDSVAFLAGRVGLPLLVFKSVVTAELSDLYPPCLLSTSAGKAVVHLVACVASFLILKHKPLHNRLIAAGIFSFHVTASNDMVIGIPVVQTFFPDGGMTQLAANVVLQYVVFQSASIVLLEIGLAQQRRVNSETETSPSGLPGPRLVTRILWNILWNPLICSIIAAIAYRLAALPFTDGKTSGLPPGVSDVVDFFTQPFSMIALFLTGANLSNAFEHMVRPGSIRRALYYVGIPVLLCVGKDIVCAFVSLAVGESVMPRPLPGQPDWHRFAFLYGGIPTSSAPLLVALQAGKHSDVVAAAIFLGLIMAVPMLIASAVLFGEGDMSTAFVQDIRAVQIAMAWISTVASVVTLVMLTEMMRKEPSWRRTPWVFLVWFAVSCLLYGASTIALHASDCTSSLFRLAFAYFQMQCRVWGALLLTSSVTASKRVARLVVPVAWLLPALLCLVSPPSTVNEVCHYEFTQATQIQIASFVTVAFVTMFALGLFGLRRKLRREGLARAAMQGQTVAAPPIALATRGVTSRPLLGSGSPSTSSTSNVPFPEGEMSLQRMVSPDTAAEQEPTFAITICSLAIALRTTLLFLLHITIGWSEVVTMRAWAPGVPPVELQSMLVENFFEHSPGVCLLMLLCMLFDTPAAQIVVRIRSCLTRSPQGTSTEAPCHVEAGVNTAYLLRPILNENERPRLA